MFLDIIDDAVSAQPDMELVGSYSTCDRLLAVSPRPTANVLIVGMEGEDLAAGCSELLYAFHDARCLAITDDGKRAFLFALRPERSAFGELSLTELVAAIRGEKQPRHEP